MPPILFRDDRFVVLDKPAGLPVHPGPRGGPSVEDFFPSLSRRKDGPWLAHRLDADTSGCLLVALRRSALLAAQAEFAAGRARKTYWAVVRGVPSTASGTIDAPLLGAARADGWRMVVDPGGKTAVTDWRVLGRCRRRRLAGTHAAHRPDASGARSLRGLGCPVLGDPIYGGGAGPSASAGACDCARSRSAVAAVASVPEHMRESLCAAATTAAQRDLRRTRMAGSCHDRCD